jgi:hypothetical protein
MPFEYFLIEPDDFEQIVCALGYFFLWHAEQRRRVMKQLAPGEIVVEVRVLGQVTNPGVSLDVVDRPAQDESGAFGRKRQPH